ncbi:unnamed protein product [Didymodactylos carnosus]|uniref:Phosphatidylinositol-specific phospholipase C X domain-containing protein n=1 Tax=Didymodactylos carnosus TaxID=1234261 RepID=A0A813XU90_9BILA|nr:unnamed protein product [Didymodactylos carnosus]CAF0953295.1 unnamed protein product [Didymodactylos carnosus]CAF3657595.1 unnamed protein product [Didymodactylos carnosus]CAF3726878.1 unnamed protein product [Didymodactylos carnosus]
MEALAVNSRTEWMKNLPEHLHTEPISKIAIPGSHDSFSYYLTSSAGPNLTPALRRLSYILPSFIRNWSKTQQWTFTEQLMNGIRYFDLRVCLKNDQFYFVHGLLGDTVIHGLNEIKEFLDKYDKEIVLLDFNHFYSFDENFMCHEQFLTIIHQIFGKKLCTTIKLINECTFNHLWENKQQVILLYELHPDQQCQKHMDRVGHFFQICDSPWPNTANIDQLFIYLDKAMQKPRSSACINVVQGLVTPDGAMIRRSLFNSLESVARIVNQRLCEWIKQRKRDPSNVNGVNIVICDFVNLYDFSDIVIQLNYKNENINII